MKYYCAARKQTVKNPKHQNQVRIIVGTLRGRKLGFADAEGLRPTPDSVRERLFNWLGQDLTGLRVLDLFAGSGALGFEAVSRQAAQVVLVEQNRHTAAGLRKAAAALGVEEKVRVEHAEALAYLQAGGESFDVVFLDPPYAWDEWSVLWQHLSRRLADGAWVYLEAARLPPLPEQLQIRKTGKAGMSRYVLAGYGADSASI